MSTTFLWSAFYDVLHILRLRTFFLKVFLIVVTNKVECCYFEDKRFKRALNGASTNVSVNVSVSAKNCMFVLFRVRLQ